MKVFVCLFDDFIMSIFSDMPMGEKKVIFSFVYNILKAMHHFGITSNLHKSTTLQFFLFDFVLVVSLKFIGFN